MMRTVAAMQEGQENHDCIYLYISLESCFSWLSSNDEPASPPCDYKGQYVLSANVGLIGGPDDAIHPCNWTIARRL